MIELYLKTFEGIQQNVIDTTEIKSFYLFRHFQYGFQRKEDYETPDRDERDKCSC